MKPHRGRIAGWKKTPWQEPNSLGFCIEGTFLDHPRFAGRFCHTSNVVAINGNEVETRNSRYTLVDADETV